MLDVSVFRNLRFSAASISVAFVFFALMGVVYFLTTYLQSVMGFTPLEAGIRMLPVAAGLIGATKLSVDATERLGTKIVVATGLGTVAAALYLLGTCGIDTGYGRVGDRAEPDGRRACRWRCRPRPSRSWARCRRPRRASGRP